MLLSVLYVDVVRCFVTQALGTCACRSQKLLSDASSVKPSNKGITEIGHDGEPIVVSTILSLSRLLVLIWYDRYIQAQKTGKRPRQSRVKKAAIPEVEPVLVDNDPGAEGEAEDDDAEVVEIRQMASFIRVQGTIR